MKHFNWEYALYLGMSTALNIFTYFCLICLILLISMSLLTLFFLAALFGAAEFFFGVVFYVLDASAERVTKKFRSDVLEGKQY